nr:hypothetical protein [Candidatus Levybacteria bacterium]
MNFKKLILAVSSALVSLSFLVVVPAFAAPGTDPNPNGNDGSGWPYSAPGYDSAIVNTVCADHGAFTYYSHGVIVGYDVPRAADGYQTGINNGTLCGQRQGNL